MRLEQTHGAQHLVEDAFSAPQVVGLLKPLERQGERKVAHLRHVAAEGLVHQRAVGEGVEVTLAMFFAQADEVGLSYERLSSRVHVKIHAQRLALLDDVVKLLIGEI